jgi:methylmalonyl-CoA mutase C-terminal domain/subunit
MEVIYLGLRLKPEQITQAAIQEDVDVVGLSCLSGAHMVLFPRIVNLIREKGAKNILVIGGGIIPEKDVPKLREAGIVQMFGPGTPLSAISTFIKTTLEAKDNDRKD